jgi:alpha-tubulin suppressor-like RCC1 family protein
MKGRPFAAPFVLVSVGGVAVMLAVACSDSAAPPPLVASQLAFILQPSTAAAGVTFAPAIAVAVLDREGHPITSATNIITLEILSNPANATLSGITNLPAVNGVATFSDVSTNKFGADYRLMASSAGLISAVSSAFNVTFGPASKLAFTVQPTTTSPGSNIAPAVLVAVRDAFDNTVTTATNAITLAISGNSGGGTLSGTTTVAAVDGIATFSNLTVDNAGQAYSLLATAANLSGATSSSFDIRVPIVFAMVKAGYFHACGMETGGQAYCWGENSAGQLGATHGIMPGAVSGGITFANVSAGRTHSCGITASGAAYCWGSNGNGELGTGGGSANFVPASVSGGHSFAALTAGYSHTCGVSTAGVGYCWGSNGNGELGNATNTPNNVPVAVSGGLTFSTVTPGRLFTCGLTTTGAAYCWGDNFWGELGDGTKNPRSSPVPVSGQLTFAAVSAGGFHACGLIASGAAYCWGDNTYGQLGNGTQTSTVAPVLVSGALTFATISVGNRHTCAVTTGGSAYCWGDNFTGHLGIGAPGSSPVPAAVLGGLTFASVSAGRFHTCGVTTAGAGYCWGDNGFGKLGDGTTVGSRVPVRIR